MPIARRARTTRNHRSSDREGLCVAVDWSGAWAGERRRLWLAAARGGIVERLECGRTRAELIAHLVELAKNEKELVVGLDFAFSFPAWFVREHADDAHAFWHHVRENGESWLSTCAPPFWGRPGRRRPMSQAGKPAFRRTEGAEPGPRGIRPKSVFQIGGAGAVGTGTLRGIPHLLDLRAAGFAIWPFDPPRAPLALEIYPRFLSGGVTKSQRSARAAYLAHLEPAPSDEHLRQARTSEDAFDALVSALAMSRAGPLVRQLEPARDAPDLLEGRIWSPTRDPLALGRTERARELPPHARVGPSSREKRRLAPPRPTPRAKFRAAGRSAHDTGEPR